MKPAHVPKDDVISPTSPNVVTVVELANLIASTTGLSRVAALHWLLYDRDGVATARRFLTKRKESQAMNRSDSLSAIVKRHGGVDPLALAIVNKGTSESITEAELTQLVTEQAKREFPNLTEAAAFTKRYAEESPRGATLRRAINFCKQQGAPLQVSGDEARDVDDPQAALNQLNRLIREMRSRFRDLSETEAWNRVVDENPELAKRAVPRPATTAHLFPRV